MTGINSGVLSEPEGHQGCYAFRMRYSLVVCGLFAACVSVSSAEIFYLPENGDTLVGELQFIKSKNTDTFPDLARRYDVGFNQMTAANPGVDPWLPGEGAHIVIPSRYVLPRRPWQGIVVNLAEMRLYYFPAESDRLGKQLVYTFPVGIGRKNWPTPTGEFYITGKIKDPVWTVPESVIQEALTEGVEMPGLLPPGEGNPLGKYVLLLNEPGYLLHGTNKPLSIGRRVSHGCLRLYPEDIEQLIRQVPRGAPVRIVDEPVVAGVARDTVFISVFEVLDEGADRKLQTVIRNLIPDLTDKPVTQDMQRILTRSATEAPGIPVPVISLKRDPFGSRLR